VAELLLARRGDDHPGLLAGDQVWTWDQVVRESLVRAAVLRRLLPAGEPPHVGVLLQNEPEYLFWLGGAAFAGATIVGANLTRRGEQLAADLRHTDCAVLLGDSEQLQLVDGVVTGVPADRVIRVGSPACDELLASGRADAASAYGDPGPLPEPRTLLMLLFTSGSTGAPKAVVCSTGRLAMIAPRAAEGFGVTREDVCYICMPLFHGNAVMAAWAPALAVGATVALRRRFSASGFLSDVRRYGATYVTYVGRALAYVLATPEQPDDADNPLQRAFGTEASARDIEGFGRRYDCQVIESYGSSEGGIAVHRPPGTPSGALGLPTPRPGSDVAVVNPETGEECPRAVLDPHGTFVDPAAIGELVERGGAPGFEGYYRNDEAMAQRLRGGWYWSGDLAYRDTDGWFWFAGRSSDWLRVDGENFAAAPVERILNRCPGVLLAAVYAVPDERTGDQVMAALELLPGAAFDPQEFATFLAAQPDLGTKWSPRYLRLVATMPLTGTNKLDKQPLRRAGWLTADPVWWRPPGSSAYQRMSEDDQASVEKAFVAFGRTHLLPTGLT
jgi:fatty-acyl-CoA synthase